VTGLTATAPQTYYLAVPGPVPDRAAGEAAAFAPVLAALLFAGWLARRHGRDPRRAGSRRWVRSLAAAFLYAAALKLSQAAYLLASEGRTPPLPAYDVAGLLVAGLLLLPVLAFADLMLEPLRPRRRRLWLPAAALGGAGLIAALSLAVAWKLDLDEAMTGLAVLRVLLIGAAAGLVWWALLPPGRDGLGAVFD
jgi:hypothetical protein